MAVETKAQATATEREDAELPSVALLSQSDRTWQTTVALDRTEIEYAVDPADPWAFDVLVIETPDKKMLRHVAAGKFKDTKVLFRMRGDPYWGIGHWYDHPFPPVRKAKQYMALKQLEWVDGCVAIAEHQAAKYRANAGRPTQLVQLSRDVSEWPDTVHTDHEIRALTLTNCMYPNKIGPIIEHISTVNDVLAETGGQWVIGGKGRYADRISDAVEGHEHVSFPGYVDAKARMKEANIMLHLSDFDSFAGAILEGCASRLPVVTTTHPAFTNADLPVDVFDTKQQLTTLLQRYADPEIRAHVGTQNEAHVADRFNHDVLGQRWADVLTWFHQNV